MIGPVASVGTELVAGTVVFVEPADIVVVAEPAADLLEGHSI